MTAVRPSTRNMMTLQLDQYVKCRRPEIFYNLTRTPRIEEKDERILPEEGTDSFG